jgi:hypothetical protein
MPRTIGYFKYKTRSSIEIYGSGSFSGTADTGYVYGWSETLTEFELRGYLNTFAGSTANAKAGMMLRTQANSNVAYIGIMVLGDNTIKVYKRATTNSITDKLATATLSVHQGIWLQITRVGTTLTFKYSTNAEGTAPGSIAWTTLHTATGIVDAWPTLEKHLCCSSGTDNVNLAYFTKVYTQDCWISPIGQKED